MPNKVSLLTEQLEDRTNRQLRETLVFRNIPEGNDEHSYNDTKEVLVTVISSHCTDITFEEALRQIK